MTAPHTKATRDDWLDAAIDALADQPIDQLKVLVLADRLGVARSSFYWYFPNRSNFVAALLERWEHNTRSIVDRSQRHAPTITAACLGVFECWADRRLFNVALDHAVREWAARDGEIANEVRNADAVRVAALASMFQRFGFGVDEATVRAQLLYHSQVGYHMLATDESVERRVARLPEYLLALTGKRLKPAELSAFAAFLDTLTEVQPVGRPAH